MPFGLQSDIPDRALPDAIRTLLLQQTRALEALLCHAQDTMDAIRANGDLSPQEKTTCIANLAQEVAERLLTLEDQNSQLQTQLEAFQRLLKLQGNPILGHTVERVKEVMEHHFTLARQQLDAIIHR